MDRVPEPEPAEPPKRFALLPPLIPLLGACLFFEVLATLGIVVRPLRVLHWNSSLFPWLAALGVAAVYVGASLAIHRRVPGWRAAQLLVAALLLADCQGAFQQLTAVLLPHTLAGDTADSALRSAVSDWRLLALSVVAVALCLAWFTPAREERTTTDQLRAVSWATILGAILCTAIPLPSAPFVLASLDHVAATAAAAATNPARLGAISFPLLWTAAVVLSAVIRPGAGVSHRWLSRALLAFSLLVVVVLAWRVESTPRVAIPLSLAVSLLVALGVRFTAPRHREAIQERAPQVTGADVAVVLVFFFSGAAALVYQVVFAKGLALTFGSTSHASTIVLATYMAGLALGSYIGGRLAERVARPVFFYAGAELGIALICAVAPYTLKTTRAVYVMIATGADPAESWLIGLQLALGAVVLMPPTLLMGVTLPMLTRHLIARRGSLGTSAGVLYSSNTLGAAIGAIATGYLIMPALGVTMSLRLAVIINIAVALTALAIARYQSRHTGPGAPLVATNASLGRSPALRDVDRTLGWIAIIQLTVGGFVTFGLETTFTHLLATIAGNSAYAFSLMLFAFLIGLGAGSNAARRWLDASRELAIALLLCQALVALALLVGVPYWDAIPRYFASFGTWLPARSFAARELIRFLACLVIMLPPAVFIGAQFPIAMEAVGRAFPEKRIVALGVASALNTVGNILGALVVGFGFLPLLGSLNTLHALTIGCLTLAALSLPYAARRSQVVATMLLGLEVLLYLRQPAQFDLSRLASGGNVYFQAQQYGRVIDSAESLDGGLTTVAVTDEDRERPILTLLTNGKFQGDDSTGGEMKAQSSFAVAPLLHTQARQRALVIGFGTGTTTKVFHQAGFQRIDVAELSGDILTLAHRHFRSVNAGVLNEERVSAHVTDGRNFLLLSRNQYDVISIELSSIWFAGAANLYNREFYQLVRQRLAPGGVLQQWVQLHRLSELDIATILTTLVEQFPHVWLYFLGKQGILVACNADCAPSRQTLQTIESAPALAGTLRLFGGHVDEVLKGRLLTPTSLEQLVRDALARFSVTKNQLIATDDNLTLEYTTPKGNVRSYIESLDQNLRYLERFKATGLVEGTALSEDELSSLKKVSAPL